MAPTHTTTELDDIARFAALGSPHASLSTLCELPAQQGPLPILAVTLGNPSPDVPAIGFFGGVHGLERIGTEVVLAFLQTIVTRLSWDDTLLRQLDSLRVVFVPLVNPVGFMNRTRANGNGVDLMRNSPVDALDTVPWMIGGQRRSSRLPWYRGSAGASMEAESQAVVDLAEAELTSHPFSIAVDCHSGFGSRDRVWFPFAHTAQPIDHLAEMHALAEMYELTHPHHRYVIEPQSAQYLTHGDLWDHIHLRTQARGNSIFLPLTLEMGSWLWVRKNPMQLFSRQGIFNPQVIHRQHRALRRHGFLLDFLTRAAGSSARWLPRGFARDSHHAKAMARWYNGDGS